MTEGKEELKSLLMKVKEEGEKAGLKLHIQKMKIMILPQCVKVKSESEVAQSCPTLSDPMDCSPTGSSIHGIFQSRVLEWGAIAFSIVTPWIAA